jgi:hypothetical protein
MFGEKPQKKQKTFCINSPESSRSGGIKGIKRGRAVQFCQSVIPAKAGIYDNQEEMDSRFHGNDSK